MLKSRNENDNKSDSNQRISSTHRQDNDTIDKILRVENFQEKRITDLKSFQDKHPLYWNHLNVLSSSL